MADFIRPKEIGEKQVELTEETRKMLYRLYGLAEAVYYNYYAEDDSKESITVTEEPEDHNGDEWTMLKYDYELIRKAVKAYNSLNCLKGPVFIMSDIMPKTMLDEIKTEWPMPNPSGFVSVMTL